MTSRREAGGRLVRGRLGTSLWLLRRRRRRERRRSATMMERGRKREACGRRGGRRGEGELGGIHGERRSLATASFGWRKRSPVSGFFFIFLYILPLRT